MTAVHGTPATAATSTSNEYEAGDSANFSAVLFNWSHPPSCTRTVTVPLGVVPRWVMLCVGEAVIVLDCVRVLDEVPVLVEVIVLVM